MPDYCNAGMLENGHCQRDPHVQTTPNQEIMMYCTGTSLWQMMSQLLDGCMPVYYLFI